MIQRLLMLSLFSLLPLQGMAEAPVVDDSENFALFDKHQAATERPFAQTQHETLNDEEVPLAHDTHDNTHSNNTNLLNKLQSMQQDIQELRGQVETQEHELTLLKQQQLTFYKDLDTRLDNHPHTENQSKNLNNEAKPPFETTHHDSLQQDLSKAVVNTAHGNPAEEEISYLAAYDLIKNKHFDAALVAMQSFVDHYPRGGYSANAQYWLGELYMVKGNPLKAIEHFDHVLKQFPSSPKAAASTLKAGYALAALGRKNEAIHHLQQILKNYPGTPTAQLATTKLEALGAL